ncbi:MAG: hypothetical protein ACI83I_001071, partial [Bacteroidia bacterium]
MTNRSIVSTPKTSIKIKSAFYKHVTMLLLVMAAAFGLANAQINVTSEPPVNNDFCGTGSPTLILPTTVTVGCGTAVSYQWYVNTSGGTFSGTTAITTAGSPNYSGYTTGTLNISNASALGVYTTYYAIVKETSVGCSAIDTIGPYNYIKVTAVPTVVLTRIGTVNECQDSLASFIGNVPAPVPAGVLTYVWSKKPDGGSAATVQTTTDVLDTTDDWSYTPTLTNDKDSIFLTVNNACGSGNTGVQVDVNPKPIVTVPSGNSTLSACKGDSVNVTYSISNAQYDPSSGSGPVSWTISATGDAALISLLPTTGSGDSSVSVFVGPTLAPGAYSATFTLIANTSDGCSRTVSTNNISVIIYPRPTVTFSVVPTDICNGSGSGTTFRVRVDSAVYTVGSSDIAVNWKIFYHEASFTTGSNCVTGTANLLPSSFTGSGNDSFTFTIPTTMAVGIYQYVLDSINNTSNSCSGTAVGTDTVSWRVDPTPNITVSPSSASACDSSTSKIFTVTATNVQFCGIAPGFGTLDTVSWILPINTGAGYIDSSNSTIPADTLTAGGTFTTDPYLAVGSHVFAPKTMTVTTPGLPGCSRDVSSKKFTLTVQPEPTVTFDKAAITMCQGSIDSFEIQVTNAMIGVANVNWTVTYSQNGASGVTGTPCVAGTSAGILPASVTGTGNQNKKYYVPATLNPGFYQYILTGVTNTSAPGTCTASPSVVGIDTITIIVEPKPLIAMDPTTKKGCELDSSLFNINVTNTVGCSGVGSTTTADWTITVHTDNVISDVSTVIPGLAGSGDAVYTVNANTTGLLTPDDHIFDASIANTTAGTPCTGGTRDTFTLSVDPRPLVTINNAVGNDTIDICQGTDSSFRFTVVNAEQNGNPVNWEITYNEVSGQVSTNCNGLIKRDLPGLNGIFSGLGNKDSIIDIPSNLPVGQYTYTITNIMNTDGPCTGTVDSITFGPRTIIINVYPKPTFSISPSTSEVCENNVATSNFSIISTNARYCSTANAGSFSNVDFDISGITDSLKSNAPNPIIAGSGNGIVGTYNSNIATSLAADTFRYTADSLTTTNLPIACINVMTSFNTHLLTVNPAPDVSFVNATQAVCEGTTDSVKVTISNATLLGSDVNWSFSVTESSGNLTSNCNIDAGQNASLVRDTTGSGDTTITFFVPNNLTSGIYTYTINNVLNTDKSCTGTSGISTITIYVYPKLILDIPTADKEVCEGETATFVINVTNGRYCSALNTASSPVPWAVTYGGDLITNLPASPWTGSSTASTTVTGNWGGTHTPGVYTFYTSSITANITSPISGTCAVAEMDTFILTINPEPIVEFDTTSLTLCEGDTATFAYIVTNAELLGTGVDWTVTMSKDSAFVSGGCVSPGISTINNMGNGDSTAFIGVPTNLAPGIYTYTLTNITNTTNGCTGPSSGIGAKNSITITINPKPTFTFNRDSITICELVQDTFTINVMNAEYCTSIGGSVQDIDWEMTFTDQTDSDVPASVWSGTGNMAATTYTVNNTFSLLEGGSPYTLDVSQIENITHSCTRTNTDTELTVIVNDLPTLVINTVSSTICDSTQAEINYTVSDVEATDTWMFTFSTDGGTTNHTVTGTGPGTGDTTTLVLTIPPGVKTVSFSIITNTTTGCEGNAPSSKNVTILPLPNVTAFTHLTSDEICSGLNNDYVITVSNSAGKNWIIYLNIDGQDTSWTGTGNGSFTRGIPVQYHQDSIGTFDQRDIHIDSMAWTGGAGTPPLCTNSYFDDDSAAVFVQPRPWINLVTPTSVCINDSAHVTYFVGGVRNTDGWDFDWYTTNPTDGPNNITGADTSTGMFSTQPLTPVGTSNVNVPMVTNTSTGCDSSYSSSPWSEDIIVDPPSYAGKLTPSYTVCDGDSGPYVFTLTGYVGSITEWDSSENLTYIWFNVGGTASNTRTITYPHLTTNYRAIVKSGACPADTSNDVILFVHPQPAAAIASIDDSICTTSNIALTLEVSGVPNTHTWTIDYTLTTTAGTTTDSFTGTGSSSSISKTLAGSFPVGNVTITLDKITNNNTGCDTLLNVVKVVKVKAAPTGSAASAAQTLCYNSNGFVKWDGTATNGVVVKWQKKTPSATSWSNISGSAGDTLEFTSLLTTTMYRAVVENAPCTGQAFSTPVTITVLTNDPTANWYNLPSNNKHCASTTNTVSMNYEVSGTNGSGWTLTILEGDSLHTVTGTGDFTGGSALTFTTSTGRLISTFNVTLVKLVISNGTVTCTKNLDNTGIAEITVIDDPNATITSVTTPICVGDSVTMTYSVSDIKSTENWKLYYTIDSTPDSISGTGGGTYSVVIPHAVAGTNGTQTVALTSIVNTSAVNSAGGNCTRSLSSSKTYVVRSTTVAGVVGNDHEVCKNSSGSVSEQTASTNGATIVNWASRSWNGTSWSAWSSTGNSGTTQTYTGITNTTQYKAIYKNSPCDSAGSNIVTVTVQELPVAVISNVVNDSICAGTTASIELTVTNVDVGAAFTVSYTEGSTSKTASFTQNGSGVHTFSTGTLNATTLITLTAITTTSQTPNCSNTASSNGTVTVIQLPSAAITSLTSPVCSGSSVTMVYSVSNVSSTETWTLGYTIATIAKTVSGTGPGTFTLAIPHTTSGNNVTQSVVLTSITNTSTLNSSGGSCSSTLTDTKTYFVKGTTAPGTITANDTVCKNASGSISQSVASTNGSLIVDWNSRAWNGSSWSTWSSTGNTSNTQTFVGITNTTQYKAIYQNSPCDTASSNTITITVLKLPVAVISTVLDDSICAGTTADLELTVTNVAVGAGFTVNYSEGSITKSATFTQNVSGLHTLTTGTLNSTTLIQLTGIYTTSQSPNCSNTANSNGTVTVIKLPTAEITSVTTPVCEGDTVTMVYSVGNVSSTETWTLNFTINGVSKSVSGTGDGTRTYKIPHTVTGSNGVQIVALTSVVNTSTLNASGGTCSSSLSDSEPYTVRSTTIPGVIAAKDSVCKNSSGSVAQSVASSNGAVIIDWQSRSWNGSSWSTWASTGNTSNTQTFVGITNTAQYKAIYMNSPCDTAASNTITIKVLELPVAVVSTVIDDSICAGTTADLELTVTNVTVGAGFTVNYSEGSITKSATFTQNASGLHTLTTGTLNSTTLIQLTGIYTTSQSPNCSNTANSNGTV